MTDAPAFRPRPETVVMADLSFVYVDGGSRTLRLGRIAYARLREQLLRGETTGRYADLFEAAPSRDDADRAFRSAECWPPTMTELS